MDMFYLLLLNIYLLISHLSTEHSTKAAVLKALTQSSNHNLAENITTVYIYIFSTRLYPKCLYMTLHLQYMKA